jgi:hypothetical protein
MARKPRIKVPGHAAVYHVVNRVAHKHHKLDTYMKNYFLELLGKLKNLYYVKYIGFTILNNHYHLLLNFSDPEDVDPAEAMTRWNKYHEETPYTRNPVLQRDRDYVVREVTDVSSFMKRFNMHMTIRFNYMHKTKVGTLWERRFRSSVVEKGAAVALCGAYIELNAFRASLVSKPEDYEYSSLYSIRRESRYSLVDTELLSDALGIDRNDTSELYQTYLAYIYKAGTRPHKKEPDGIVITEKMRKKLRKHNLDIQEGSLSQRIIGLLEGKIIGSERMIQDTYESNEHNINPDLTGADAERYKKWWIYNVTETNKYILDECSTAMRGSP